MKKLASFILCLGFSASCLAKVDIKTTKRLIIPVDNVTPKLSQADVAKVVPMDMPAGTSQGTLLTRMVDRGVSLWLNSPLMKNSAVGRIAEETQQKLKTDVVVPADKEGGVNHKFSLKVEAFQALAKLEYEGWTKAAINFDAKSSSTNFSLKEKVFDNKELFLTHKADKEQDLSMVGLAWSW